MSYKHHHAENVSDRNDYTSLDWEGESVSFETEIGTLKFIPICGLASIGVEWTIDANTERILKSHELSFWRNAMPSGGRALKFRNEEEATAVKEKFESEQIPFVVFQKNFLYILPIPVCPFEEWWESQQPKLQEYLKCKRWLEDKRSEIESKGWDLEKQYSGNLSISVTSRSWVELRSSKYDAGCCYVYIGDEIPLAEDLEQEKALLNQKQEKVNSLEAEIATSRRKPQTLAVKAKIAELTQQLQALKGQV